MGATKADPSKKFAVAGSGSGSGAGAGPARSSEYRYPKVDRGGSRIKLSPTCAARVFQLTRQLGHKTHGQTIEWLADPSKRLADARSRRLSKGHKFDGLCKRVRIPATCATRVYELSRDLGHTVPGDTIEWMLKKAEPAIIAAKKTGKIPAMFACQDPGASPSPSPSPPPTPTPTPTPTPPPPPPFPSPPPPSTATLSGFHQAGHQQRQQTSPQFIFSSEQTKNEIPSSKPSNSYLKKGSRGDLFKDENPGVSSDPSIKKETYISSHVQQKMAIMGYHHFFKPMIGNFQKKLMIPIQFLKHLRGETLDEAFLLAPLGESWHVGLKRDVNNSLWFDDGWHEFIKAHNILLGYFLVFGYVGKMTFDVKIFDRTSCMKEYPCLAYRKDQTQRGKDGKDVEPSRKRREFEEVKERETSNFKATIKYSNLSRAYMGIPMPFMKRNLLGLEKAISLKDPAGRSWPVKITKRHNQCAYSFGSGWAKFHHANELKKGDTCRFEVSSNMKHVLCVSISKAAKEK